MSGPTARGRRRAERWLRGEADGALARAGRLLLAPAEAAYAMGSGLYHRAYSANLLLARAVPAPVISVGNIAVGGAGKTPVARWLIDELLRRRRRPALLHGGYAADEPALHRRWHPDVPVLAGRDRLIGAQRALAAGADVLVLDDGFQHRRLARDLDLVLVAAEHWAAPRHLLPRGPWREPLASLGRAHLVAVTRKAAEPEAAAAVREALGTYARAEVLQLGLLPGRWLRPDGSPAEPTEQRFEAAALAGVAEPRSFLVNARSAGADIQDFIAFPDHHAYDRGDIDRIRSITRGRPIATTAKDAVKLALLAPDLDLRVLEQDVVVEHGADVLADTLTQVLRSWPERPPGGGGERRDAQVPGERIS
jgi:tetraacyldisaccharide 4'-kinase